MAQDSILLVDSKVDNLDLSRTLAAGESLDLQLVNLDRTAPLKLTGQITLEEGAHLRLVEVDLGRFDCRVDLTVTCLEDSSFDADIAALNEGNETKVYAFNVIHIGKRSESLTSMRGVCSDTSRMEFLGSSDIRRGAAKTHTRQEGKIVNLSGRAKCIASPSLLISEEDVYASHGASMGSVPDTDMFYLMSRGLSRQAAERLITVGYLKPACELIADRDVQARALTLLESAL